MYYQLLDLSQVFKWRRISIDYDMIAGYHQLFISFLKEKPL